jgi:hypothetical protein
VRVELRDTGDLKAVVKALGSAADGNSCARS